MFAPETAANVSRIEIDCNAHKGEIRTTVHHRVPEVHHLGDPNDTRNTVTGKVEIKARRFYAYGRTPGQMTARLARFMRDEVVASLPGIPVSLYGA